jgi:hypothetical protein
VWWQPRSEEEGQLAEVLPRLVGLFLENRQRGTILGVGTFLVTQFYRWWINSGFTSYWRSLSTWRRIASALLPGRIPLRTLDFYNLGDRLYYSWQYREMLIRGSGRYRYSPPLVLLNMDLAVRPIVPMAPYFRFDLPTAAESEVASWNLPDETVFLFVSPPEPVSVRAPVATQTNRAIRCASTGGLGTAGVRLRRTNAPTGPGAFLTVGHLFPGGRDSVVEEVEYRWPRWLRPLHSHRVGRVANCSSPVGANVPAYDAAVVEMEAASHLPDLAHSGVAVTPPHYTSPVLGTIYGGVSGVVRDASIVGTLNAYGSPEMLWKNSWILTPSGAIVRGDSGSAFVLDDANQVAGMVVGGSRRGTSKKYTAQYVQDMASIERDFLRPAGFSVA